MKVVILRKKKKSNITARMNAKIQHVDKGIKKLKKMIFVRIVINLNLSGKKLIQTQNQSINLQKFVEIQELVLVLTAESKALLKKQQKI